MNETLSTLVIAAVVIAVFGGQYLLGRLGTPKWTAAFIPVAFIGAVIFFAVNGTLNSFRDYLMPAIGFFALLVLWEAGAQRRKKKTDVQ